MQIDVRLSESGYANDDIKYFDLQMFYQISKYLLMR